MVSVFGWPDPNTWDVARVFSFSQLSQHPSVFGLGHPNTETIR